uniref:Uncharacterized protein n=1 Tax=Canis lupus dingo TaxID=286419 RepID=A0A8C0LMH6_CANLU
MPAIQADALLSSPLLDRLCLAFVESRFNISKGNENADGSFQINSHYWCNDDRSHSENICHEDCQGLARAPGWGSSTHKTSIPMQGLGMVAWRLHCAGRPLSYWMTGCFSG